MQSKPRTAGSGTKAPPAAAFPSSCVTFRMCSPCEITQHAPPSRPLKETRSSRTHTHQCDAAGGGGRGEGRDTPPVSLPDSVTMLSVPWRTSSHMQVFACSLALFCLLRFPPSLPTHTDMHSEKQMWAQTQEVQQFSTGGQSQCSYVGTKLQGVATQHSLYFCSYVRAFCVFM